MSTPRMALCAALLIAVAVAAPALLAQEGPPPPHPPHGGPGFGEGFPPPPEGGPRGPGRPGGDGPMGGPGGEFFAEVMMARLSDELELSDEQTVLMVRKFSGLRDQVRDLRKQRTQAARELELQLQSKSPDAAKTQEQLDKVIALDSQIRDERQKVFEEMGAELDPVKKAKLYLFLDQFESDMRRMIGEARERFRGGRPDGNGPPPRHPGGPGQEGPHPGGPPHGGPHHDGPGPGGPGPHDERGAY